MHKKAKPQHAGLITADAVAGVADDLGISNEEERARLQDWMPRVIAAFHMHKRDKAEKLTPAQQIDKLSAFEKKTALFAKYWADGRICSMMMLYERARVLGNEKLTVDEKVPLLDAVDQSVLDDAQGIASRIENVLARVRAMITALEERTSLPVPPATQFAVHWLTEQCFDYWRTYLGHERGAAGGRRQIAGKGQGGQLRFIARIFGLRARTGEGGA